MAKTAPNCYDLLAELDPTMRELKYPDYFLLGGIVTGALKHDAVVFDHDAQRVIAPPGSGEPVERENGSHRDADILVPEVLSKKTKEKIKKDVSEMVEGQLNVSIFTFDARQAATALKRLKWRAQDWTSRRTVDEQGTLRYELWPLEQAVSPASYEPWTFELPDGASMKMLHPAAHVLAYRMRSISGVRHKDLPKVQAATHRVVQEPEFREAINDGPLVSWRSFADAILTLRDGRLDQPGGEAVEPRPSPLDQGLFFGKGNILRGIERSQKLVDFGQSDWMQEHVLKPFVRAQ